MASYRIETNLIDRSSVAIADNSVAGAMVIKASKGPKAPVFVDKGNTDRIIDLFGAPAVSTTATYSDVYEAIKFNEQDGLYISSPYADSDSYGGVCVTKYGTNSLPNGSATTGTIIDAITDGTITTITTVYTKTYTETLFTTDGTNVTYTGTLLNEDSNMAVPTSGNLTIYQNGVSIGTLTIAGASPYTIACAGVLDGTLSTLNKTTGAFSIKLASAGTAGRVFTMRYTAPDTAAASNYFYILARSPYTDDLAVKVTYNTTYSYWNITLYKIVNSNYVTKNEYKISFTMGAKDGFGKDIYYRNVLLNNDYIQVIFNSASSITTFVDDATTVDFDGGSRTVAGSITTADIVECWDYYNNFRTYPAKIFMSPLADVLVAQKFDTLRTTYNQYAKYILPLPQASSASTAISDKAGYSINNRGLRFYWNWAKVNTVYGSFWTSLIGRVGAKHAQMKNVYFGRAPAWVDEDGHGGQLGPGVIQMAFDPTETELQNLDTAGINPIIFDPTYGVMIVSQKTAQNAALVSDTSYIGHSDVIDYIFENMINQVLTYQTCKLNDPFHRQMALSKAYQLTNPIVASGALQEVIHKCDSGNNTDETMAQRKFIFTTALKVTPFSERIVYNLIATEQSVKLEEVLS